MVLQNCLIFTEMYLVPLLGTTNANLDYLLRNFCLFTLWAFLKDKSVNSVQNTHSRPVNLHPLFLKIGHPPCFLKIGHPAFCKKQGHFLFIKRRDQAASSLFEWQWPCFFALCFFQKTGCPIFKNIGCRLTGQIFFILSAWLCIISGVSKLASPLPSIFDSLGGVHYNFVLKLHKVGHFFDAIVQ